MLRRAIPSSRTVGTPNAAAMKRGTAAAAVAYSNARAATLRPSSSSTHDKNFHDSTCLVQQRMRMHHNGNAGLFRPSQPLLASTRTSKKATRPPPTRRALRHSPEASAAARRRVEKLRQDVDKQRRLPYIKALEKQENELRRQIKKYDKEITVLRAAALRKIKQQTRQQLLVELRNYQRDELPFVQERVIKAVFPFTEKERQALLRTVTREKEKAHERHLKQQQRQLEKKQRELERLQEAAVPEPNFDLEVVKTLFGKKSSTAAAPQKDHTKSSAVADAEEQEDTEKKPSQSDDKKSLKKKEKKAAAASTYEREEDFDDDADAADGDDVVEPEQLRELLHKEEDILKQELAVLEGLKEARATTRRAAAKQQAALPGGAAAAAKKENVTLPLSPPATKAATAPTTTKQKEANPELQGLLMDSISSLQKLADALTPEQQQELQQQQQQQQGQLSTKKQ